MSAAIQNFAFTSGPSSNTLSVSSPANIAAGELIVAYLDCNTANTAWTAPDGSWTLQTSNSTGAIFTKVATSSEPATWTFTRNGLSAVNRATVAAVTGWGAVDSTQLVVRSSKNAAVAFVSQPVSQTNGLFIQACLDFSGTGTPYSAPSGTTKLHDASDGFLGYDVVQPTATGTRSWSSANTSFNAGAAGIVITPSASTPGKDSFYTAGTYNWTCPTGVTGVTIECEGAGGAGGRGSSTGGCGGGGGAYATSNVSVVPGQTYTLVVGQGGAPSATTTAGAGGDSSFGANVVLAKGGGGGRDASNQNTTGIGGQASASIGQTTTSGSTGGNGVLGGAGGAGGAGAPSLGGAGGAPSGGNGASPGGGGAGGDNTGNIPGGSGADGAVVISYSTGTSNVPGKVTVTYNASNTFTVPTGVTSLRIQAEGAGGGGGTGSGVVAGGGGGGGGYAEEPALAVTAGQTFAITIPGTTAALGTGGNAVVSRSGTVVVQANGGAPGKAGSGLTAGAGGAGGTGATGSIKNTGTSGTSGGAGGAGAAPLGRAGGATSGGAGVAPGGGGGGGAALSSGPGGTGGQGTVVISFAYASDAVGPSDNVQLLVTWRRSYNDTVASTDALAKTILRPLTDTAAVTDSLTKLVVKKMQNESLTANDVFARALTQSRSDGLSATDLATVTLVALRYFNDAGAASDYLAKQLGLSKADAVAVVDSVFKLAIKKISGDSALPSDAFARVVGFQRAPADGVSTADVYQRSLQIRFNDSISGTSAPAPTGGTRKIYVISD